LTSENEYKRAIHIIENSLLIDTGQRVRSIEARDPFGNVTRLYDREKGEITGTLQTEKGENSIQMEKPDLVCVIVWLGIGIFCGLILAGIIYGLTV
jgi:hypothetical protein